MDVEEVAFNPIENRNKFVSNVDNESRLTADVPFLTSISLSERKSNFELLNQRSREAGIFLVTLIFSLAHENHRATTEGSYLENQTHKLIIGNSNRPIRLFLALPTFKNIRIQNPDPRSMMRYSDFGEDMKVAFAIIHRGQLEVWQLVMPQ